MTGRVWHLPTFVSVYPEVDLIVPVSGLDKVAILLDMLALQGLVDAAVARSAISAAVHKLRARLILLA